MNANPFDVLDGQASAISPSLDADLSDPTPTCSETTKRVCITTPDILDEVRNGGIGTAYQHLARLLAEWGHEVVIAYVNGDAENRALMAKAEAVYAELGIAFAPIAPRPMAKTALAEVAAPTWALLEWLRARERPFDIVHVSEWRGLGYGPLLAKALGLGFAETHFVVKGSSPTLWAAEGNRQLLSTEHDLGWVFMERRSVELADTVICGSAHLLGWMREAGYALPERSFVWPNVFPAPDPAAAAARGARDGVALAEVVFFGRLEPRKGLVLFIDAMDRLVRQGRAPARITFLGKPSSIFDGLRHIQHATRGWPVQVRTLTGYGSGEAVAYLSEPGRLAVIPSLLENSSMAVMECLQAGIPFVAAATGGDAGAGGAPGPGAGVGGGRAHRAGRAHCRVRRGAAARGAPALGLRALARGVVALAWAERAVRGVGRALCAARARGTRRSAVGDGVHRAPRAPGAGAHGGRERVRAGLPGARGGAGR